jgi:uncharacterized membrane protein YjjB (DUF3815 family)
MAASSYIQMDDIWLCALGAGCGMLVCFLLEKLFKSKKAENLRAFAVGVGATFAILWLKHHCEPLPTAISVAAGAAIGVFAVVLLIKFIHWMSKNKEE